VGLGLFVCGGGKVWGGDMGSATRGCKGVSSKQWELGSAGVVQDVAGKPVVFRSKACLWAWRVGTEACLHRQDTSCGNVWH
jgi:hypothetical protein